MASGGADGDVVLWDLTDRDRPRPLGEPLDVRTGSVDAVAFAPDRPALAAGGDGGTVGLWDLSPLWSVRGEPVQAACAITGRGLDREEWDRYVGGPRYADTCAP